METDFQKLNIFDTSTVFVAAVGVLLVGLIVFLSFPEKQQQNILYSFRTLDASRTVEQQEQNLLLALGSANSFYNSFFGAFNELAAIPDDFLSLPNQISYTFEKIGEYSDYIVNDYQQQAAIAQSNQDRGEILGAFIDKSINSLIQNK